MKLDEKFSIEQDTHSWNLVEKVSEAKDKGGNPKFNDDGSQMWNVDTSYHANLKQALVWYLHKAPNGSTDITDAISAISEAEKRIENLVEMMQKESQKVASIGGR